MIYNINWVDDKGVHQIIFDEDEIIDEYLHLNKYDRSIKYLHVTKNGHTIRAWLRNP